MLSCLRAAALLLCFTSLALTARSQSCTEQLRQASSHVSSRTVSATALQIPLKAWQHFEKARIAGETNQPELFERESAKALAAAPNFAEVYLLKAVRDVRDRHYTTALATLATARTLQPNLPWSSIVAASALTALERYSDAVAELDRARGEEAESWQASFERARAEVGRRDSTAALLWSTRALTAAPAGCTDARLLRANALQLAGRRPEAITELETFLDQDRQGTNHTAVLTALAHIRQSVASEGHDLLAQR